MSRTPTEGSAPPEPPERTRHNPHDPPRRFVAYNEHERIQVAAAQVISIKGYEATTVGDICAEAHISVRTFYEHFAGKQEVALSAVEAVVDKAMADCREAFRGTEPWPEAIWETFAVYVDWVACEPAFARLAFVEMLSAGPTALDLLQSLMDAFAMFLQPGYELLPKETPSRRLVDETVANGVFGLLHEYILRESPEMAPTILPEVVRTILTPFLGARATAEFVQARRQQPPRRKNRKSR